MLSPQALSIGRVRQVGPPSQAMQSASASNVCTRQPEASIAARVAKGAGLFICIDERWTREATAALANAGLFPEAVELSGGMQQRRIAEWDREHPALAKFDGKDGGDLRLLSWRDAFTIQPGEGWKALATLDGGHPLLLEKISADPKAGRHDEGEDEVDSRH